MSKILVLILTLLFVTRPAGAAAITLAEVSAALQKPFRQSDSGPRIRNFAAEFTQESLVAAIDRVQRGEGTVRVKLPTGAPAKFRWDYRQPDVQEILSDGETLWVYVPENRQVIVSDLHSMDPREQANPLTFLGSLGDLEREFTVTWAAERETPAGHFRLELTPRRPSPLFERMEVVVNREALGAWQDSAKEGTVFPVVATRLADAQGNLTTVSFFDVKINQSFPDRLFHFSVPSGVEVVRPGQQSGI